jgi:hypothetical protein
MIALFAARLWCVLAVLAPVVLALQPTQAAATVGAAAGARDGANAAVLTVVRLGTTDKLFLRGADLAIVTSGACALLAQAERLECLESLRDIAPALRPRRHRGPDQRRRPPTSDADLRLTLGGYLARSEGLDALSGSPAFAVRGIAPVLHLGPDRPERTEFVLLQAEIVGVRAIWRIDRFLEPDRKILLRSASRAVLWLLA